MRHCPSCAGEIQEKAVKCNHCGASLKFRLSGCVWGCLISIGSVFLLVIVIGFLATLEETRKAPQEKAEKVEAGTKGTVSREPQAAETLMVNVQVANIRQGPTTEAAIVKKARFGDFLHK